MKIKGVGFLAIGAILIVVLGGFTSSVWAQSSSTGALAGTVSDPSGAVIPNATVTLRNNETGQTQTATTGANGTYRFSLLTPGTYSVTFAAPGFKTSQVPSVTVNVTEVPVLDAKLEVGEATQQVTVTGEAVALQTETSAIGTLVDSKAITSIPLTTRNYTQVISLSAGATYAVNNAAILGRGTQDGNVNGNSTSSNNYQMDGADANNWTINTATNGNNEYGGISIPNPDALAEFKIQTSQYDAGYGRNAGANVNVVTKSGTNDYHGTVFEFNRNTIFNANTFFRNELGQPKPQFKQNQFGGVFGGPIKKDKLFFFVSYQGTRQINGLDATALSTDILPPLTNTRTAAQLGSQFGLVTLGPGSYASCANPTVALATGAFALKNVTYAGGTQVACDGSNINPIALTLLNYKNPDGTYLFPTPQSILTSGSNAGLGSSSFSVPSSFREDQVLVNTDYVINSKHTLSERFFRSYLPTNESFNVEATGGVVPGNPAQINYTDDNVSLKLTSILTNSLVNEARMGFTQDFDLGTGLNVPTAASIGMTPVDKFFPEPGYFVIGGSLGSFAALGGTGNDWVDKSNQLQFSDQISWVRGKHSFRFGGQFEKVFWNVLATGRARGTITINNFTDFLLGQSAAQNGSPSGLSNIYSVTAQESLSAQGALDGIFVAYPGSAFFQDDIKVSSKFTLNLGLRWEYVPGSFDNQGKTGNILPQVALLNPVPPLTGSYIGISVSPTYNPNLINPYTNLPFGPPPPGVIMRPDKTLYTNNTPLDNFGPRLGFAWQPIGSRLVLRGGYGWFYQTSGGNAMNTAGLTTQPFAQRIANTGSTNNFATLQQAFPTTTLGFIPRTPTSQLTDVVGGPTLRTPMVQEWSLNTQYQLAPTWTLEVGYVGAEGSHLFITQGFNQPVLASTTNPVNCGYDGVPTDCITTNTSKNAALRVPMMGFTPTALKGSGFSGNSWYHGLQTTLRKQFSHGLTTQVAYTYSKSEADVFSGDNDLYTAEWSPQTFNRTHRLIVSYTYQLPVPSSVSTGFAGAVLNGWMVSGVTTAQTGTPLTITDGTGGTIYGNANGSTAEFCPGATNASVATSGRDQTRLTNWFNKSAICSIPVSPFASDTSKGYGNMGQNIVTGPGQFNWDVSLEKITRVGGIRENAQLQFRAEFYNAFNHAQFSNPGASVSSSSTFGVITATTVAPRLIQFGLKYLF